LASASKASFASRIFSADSPVAPIPLAIHRLAGPSRIAYFGLVHFLGMAQQGFHFAL